MIARLKTIWRQLDAISRLLVVLLIVAIVMFGFLVMTRSKWLSRSSEFDVLLEYELRELRSQPGLDDQGRPVIFYFHALGDLRASNGVDYNYAGPTCISLTAFRSDIKSVRDWIVEYLNSSEEHAKGLIFHDRPQIRFAALEAVAHECYQKKNNRLVNYVYEVMSGMAVERDPFFAAFPLIRLKEANHWNFLTFKNAIKHPIAVVRAEAIQYGSAMMESMNKDDRLEVMTILASTLDDPHIGIRQISTSALRDAYLAACRSLPENSPERSTAASLQEIWSSNPDEATQNYLERARSDEESWLERITSLRNAL